MRAVIFIDGGYLEKVLNYYRNPKIDFNKLVEKLSGGREVLRTYYYHCLPYKSAEPTEEETKSIAREKNSIIR